MGQGLSKWALAFAQDVTKTVKTSMSKKSRHTPSREELSSAAGGAVQIGELRNESHNPLKVDNQTVAPGDTKKDIIIDRHQ